MRGNNRIIVNMVVYFIALKLGNYQFLKRFEIPGAIPEIFTCAVVTLLLPRAKIGKDLGLGLLSV
jgi:hypothetical protein